MTQLHTLLTDVRACLAPLAKVGEDPARLARLVIAHATGVDLPGQVAHPDTPLTAAQIQAALAMATRMAKGEPLSRILGVREFYGLDFHLSPDTLDPRPETELIVDAALAWLRDHPGPRRVLDLGTGTGCIPIAILKHSNPHVTGVAVDIAPGAVEGARANAATHDMTNRLDIIQSDWAAMIGPGEKFDVITSNPPYIPSAEIIGLSLSVRNHDPIRALDGGADGLVAYARVFTAIKNHLAPGGVAFLELGAGQDADVSRLAMKYGLDVADRIVDSAGHTRVLRVAFSA